MNSTMQINHTDLGKLSLIDAAEEYAKFGWFVYPVAEKAKIPIIKDWPNQASIETVQIVSWWSRWPDANIGLSCGPSGIIAVDLDLKNGGPENWDEICGKLEYYDQTVTAISGSGGKHLFFKCPAGIEIDNPNCLIEFGIEIKSKGKGIVIAPSIHPNGNRYRWVEELDPFSSPMAIFPSVILEYLKKYDKSRPGYFNEDGLVKEGYRDNFIFRQACKMVSIGMSKDQIIYALLSLNETKCSPPLPDKQILTKVESALKYRSETLSEKPIITYVLNGDKISTLFGKILDIISPTMIFYDFGGDLVCIEPEHGPIYLNQNNLNGYLLQYFEIKNVTMSKNQQERLSNFQVVPKNHVSMFLSNPEVKSRLPKLRSYSKIPLVNGRWEILSCPGYHREEQIFYDGPPITPAKDHPLLDQMLCETHWKSASDKANFIAVLLTGITIGKWIGHHPIVALNGNKSQVGKSTLAKMIGLILGNEVPSTISYHQDQAEMEKAIATEILNGQPVVIIDNIKGAGQINSPVLERCITDKFLNFRLLGSNHRINRQNDIIFITTMNDSKFSRDLQNRDIPINLEIHERVQEVKYSIPNIDAWVQENRLGIISELYGMIEVWKGQGMIIDSKAKHTIGGQWAETIDSILKANGIFGFLDNYEESNKAFDADFELMTEICAQFHNQGEKNPTEWAELLRKDILAERLSDSKGNLKPERTQAQIIGKLFKGYVGERILCQEGEFTFILRQISTRPVKYVYSFVRNE